MILNNEDREQYLERPADALDVTLEVVGDTITITFNNEVNSDYIVTLKDIKDKNGNELIDPIVYKFTSTYSPLFASQRQIISDIGNIFPSQNADTILYAIRSNSIDVQYVTTKEGIDWTNPPYEVKQYVRYKTDLDLLVGKYSESTSSSTEQIALGDFSVTAGSSSSTAFKMLTTEMKNRSDYWLKRLGAAAKSAPQSFVKGGTNWPDHLTRGF